MTTLKVDVAIIGAGTAGLAAYRAAHAAGARAVLIEGGAHGTTCARVGCMPSKLLIAAAESVHAIGGAPGFGIHVDGALRVDGREVMARVKRERDRFVDFVVQGIDAIPASDHVRGHARFLDRNTLEVDGKVRIAARAIVIATGSRPTVPPILRGLGDRLVVNDDVFAWDGLPRSVVRVVVLGRGGRVGPITDPYVKRSALQAFGHDFALDTDAHVSRVERVGDEVEIDYASAGGEPRTERFDYVLAATGRVPNVDALGLENLDLARDARGVPLYDRRTLQAQSTPIFIAGDAADDAPLLHEAADEGRIAGANAALFPAVKPGPRRALLGIVFTDPQIAIVGGGFASLKAAALATGEVSFEDQGRARVMLRNRGHLRVYADPTNGRFLGAEMVGPDAEHIGHLLAWALQNEMTVARMLEMPFYHPVVEEGLRTALRELDAKIREAQAEKDRRLRPAALAL
jgi:dihydrolipoamide dehydrogenase